MFLLARDRWSSKPSFRRFVVMLVGPDFLMCSFVMLCVLVLVDAAVPGFERCSLCEDDWGARNGCTSVRPRAGT